MAFLFDFCLHKGIANYNPKWTIIFTFLGIDGYISRIVPNFTLVGEWFLRALLIMYLFFPFIRVMLNKHKNLFIIICFTLSILVQTFYYRTNIFRTNISAVCCDII